MKLTVRHIVAYTVSTLIGLVGLWYCYLIIVHEIRPVLSTWLLFFVATLLGLITYLRAKQSERSIITNIANSTDVVMTGCVFLCILAFGGELELGFSPLDLGCFTAAGAVFLYYLIHQDAFRANLAVNALLVVAYLPTVARLWTAEQNTESFILWLVILFAALISLYNPIRKRDFLAILYAARGIVLVCIILALMLRIELR